jgi:hypothetical protein
MVRHQRRTCDLSRPAARSIGSGGLSSGSRGNVSGASVIPQLDHVRGCGLVSAKRCAVVWRRHLWMGPPANPAPDEGPGVLAGGGSDCSRCFSAGQLCRSMVRAQLATAHVRSPRGRQPTWTPLASETRLTKSRTFREVSPATDELRWAMG